MSAKIERIKIESAYELSKAWPLCEMFAALTERYGKGAHALLTPDWQIVAVKCPPHQWNSDWHTALIIERTHPKETYKYYSNATYETVETYNDYACCACDRISRYELKLIETAVNLFIPYIQRDREERDKERDKERREAMHALEAERAAREAQMKEEYQAWREAAQQAAELAEEIEIQMRGE